MKQRTSISNAQRIHCTTLVVQDTLKRIQHNNALLIHFIQQAVLVMLLPTMINNAQSTHSSQETVQDTQLHT